MKKRTISWILIFTGVTGMIVGFMRGEAAQVLQKGIRICLECIGLG